MLYTKKILEKTSVNFSPRNNFIFTLLKNCNSLIFTRKINHLRWVHFLTKQEQLCLKIAQQNNVHQYFVYTCFKSS